MREEGRVLMEETNGVSQTVGFKPTRESRMLKCGSGIFMILIGTKHTQFCSELYEPTSNA